MKSTCFSKSTANVFRSKRNQFVCVDDDLSEVKLIVEEARSVEDRMVWKCDSCGEAIGGQVTAC